MMRRARRVLIGSLALVAVLVAGCADANEQKQRDLLGGRVPAQAPAPDVPAIQPLAFAHLERGQYSGVTQRQVLLMTSQEEWETNWKTHAARQIPSPPAPGFDFGKESILAAYLGEQTTGGYDLAITEVKQDGDRLLVTVKQSAPSPDSAVTMALTQPYHMVRIPQVPAGTRVDATWQ